MVDSKEVQQLRGELREVSIQVAALETLVKLLVEWLELRDVLADDDKKAIIQRVRRNLAPNANLPAEHPGREFSDAVESAVVDLFVRYP